MPQHNSKTHYLFLRIIAAVAQSSTPMTVAALAKALDTDPDVIAHCIGLHLYLERKQVTEMPLPPPADYRVPALADVISGELLQPRLAGRMMAVETAIRAMGRAVVDTLHH
jgi:hypothetical protein